MTYEPDCWGNGIGKQTTCSKQVQTILLKLNYVLQSDIDHSANNRNNLSELETNVCKDMEWKVFFSLSVDSFTASITNIKLCKNILESWLVNRYCKSLPEPLVSLNHRLILFGKTKQLRFIL